MATFFLTGRFVQLYRALARSIGKQIWAGGNQTGDHADVSARRTSHVGLPGPLVPERLGRRAWRRGKLVPGGILPMQLGPARAGGELDSEGLPRMVAACEDARPSVCDTARIRTGEPGGAGSIWTLFVAGQLAPLGSDDDRVGRGLGLAASGCASWVCP